MRRRPGLPSFLVLGLAGLAHTVPVAIDDALAARRGMGSMSSHPPQPRNRDADLPDDRDTPMSTPVPIVKPVVRPATTNTSPAAATPKPALTPEIYLKQAKQKLEADQAASMTAQKPHPLAEGFPDHLVTVCLAGCVGEKVRVAGLVQRAPRVVNDASPAETEAKPAPVSTEAKATQPVAETKPSTPAAEAKPSTPVAEAKPDSGKPVQGEVVPTAATAPEPVVAKPTPPVETAAPALGSAVCVAGCYGILPLGLPRRAKEDRASANTASESTWMTTSTRAPDAGSTPRARKTKKPGPSGEWFSRINRERVSPSRPD